MQRTWLFASTLLLLGACLLNCSRSPHHAGNGPDAEPEIDSPYLTPPQKSTPSAADIAAVNVPAIFTYEITVYNRYGKGNRKMYKYRLDQQGNVSFQSFSRDPGRDQGAAFDFKISRDQLKKIVYYYQEVDLRSLKTDYSDYDPRNCGYASDRGPHLYVLRIMADRKSNTVQLLEFCNEEYGDIEDLLRLVKVTDEISYLRPHVETAVTAF